MLFSDGWLQAEFKPLIWGQSEGCNEPSPSFWDGLSRRHSKKPKSSPWGEIVDSNVIADGILWFKTAARSGYRLSGRRQRVLPSYFRTIDRWYEDVCEWAAIAVVFDGIFDKMPSGRGTRSLYDLGKETLKNWRPEGYEIWFQTMLDRAEIDSLAITQFYRLHAEHFIAVEVLGNRHAHSAQGLIHIRAKRGGDPPYGVELGVMESPSRWFLVGADDFMRERGRPFLIDPRRHTEVAAPPVLEKPEEATEIFPAVASKELSRW